MNTTEKQARHLRMLYLGSLLIILGIYFVHRIVYEVYLIGDLFLVKIHFLVTSLLIVGLAAINYRIGKTNPIPWAPRYTLFLFFGMIFGFLGDVVLGNVLGLPIEPLMLGVPMFFIGHIFYLMALNQQSPLLLSKSNDSSQSSSSIINPRNLLVIIAFNLFGITLFYFTMYNPAELVIGVAFLVYGLMLLTVLAFAFTKFFDKQYLRGHLFMFLGLLLFFISDYLLGINQLTIPLLYAALFIHALYLPGQLFIHLSPLVLPVTERR